MGYESKLYIVRKAHRFLDERIYAERIAEFRLCKCPQVADCMSKQPVTDCYIYADDGNTHIIEDRYGDKLTEAPLSTVIAAIEKAMQDGDDYWRFPPVLAALKAFEAQNMNLTVLHFGY